MKLDQPGAACVCLTLRVVARDVTSDDPLAIANSVARDVSSESNAQRTPEYWFFVGGDTVYLGEASPARVLAHRERPCAPGYELFVLGTLVDLWVSAFAALAGPLRARGRTGVWGHAR